MTTDDIDAGLRAARTRLLALRPAVIAGAPWPLAARFDDSPEASWGPPEVLAHLAEMIPFWQGQLGRVAAGSPDGGPVPFGRSASDTDRLAEIARLRMHSVEDLYHRLDAAIDGFLVAWAGWSPAERARPGLHPIRGELTVETAAARLIVGHLVDHAAQLEAVLVEP